MAKKTSIELYSDLVNELQSENQKPIYFLYGEEKFFLDRLQNVVEGLIPDDQKDFNFDLLYGRDTTPAQILSVIRSYPMMAEQRIVILRDFNQLNSYSPAEHENGGDVNDLLPYLEQPNHSTLFVCIDEKKPHGNTKIGKAFSKSKYASMNEFEEVPEYRLPDWISSWAKHHHNKKMSPPAAQMLARYVGNSLQLVSTEIDKVCTFVDSSESISQKDIKKVIGLYREYTVFELKDALFSRKLDNTLFIAEQMLQHNTVNTGEIIRTVGFFYSVFSKIWQIRRLSAEGKSKNDIRQKMGINNNWYFNKLWEDASAFNLSEMPKIFEALLDADRAAKGFTATDPPTIFFLMIKRIIN